MEIFFVKFQIGAENKKDMVIELLSEGSGFERKWYQHSEMHGMFCPLQSRMPGGFFGEYTRSLEAPEYMAPNNNFWEKFQEKRARLFIDECIFEFQIKELPQSMADVVKKYKNLCHKVERNEAFEVLKTEIINNLPPIIGENDKEI